MMVNTIQYMMVLSYYYPEAVCIQKFSVNLDLHIIMLTYIINGTVQHLVLTHYIFNGTAQVLNVNT